jgi:RNA polymerase sigma-70 factor (ECF subfamily)
MPLRDSPRAEAGTTPAGRDPIRAVEAVWRIESAGVVAILARRTGDVALAEDLAQDAFLAALQQWPAAGTPPNPRAWLLTVAKRRHADLLRRKEAFSTRGPELDRQARQAQQRAEDDEVAAAEGRADQELGDDVLRLVFSCCHPALTHEAQVALTLRAVAGLTTAQIARAFLVPEPTVAQRIVRAKRRLQESGVGFELPKEPELPERLAAVLDVVYLIFNEGYVPTAGEKWADPSLCADAVRLGRVLAGLLPGESEVHGLVALMELQSSRLRARIGADGRPVLLGEQDRRTWDRLLISRGLSSLERARAAGPALGRFGLQAAIAACHARADAIDATDWVEICSLYDALAAVAPSPVVELNRAVAVSMAFGPGEALGIVEQLAGDRHLAHNHLLWSVRADLLERLGERDAARASLGRAVALASNESERRLLEERASRL